MKFCKDCKHVEPEARGHKFARCTLRGAITINLVNGEPEDERPYCTVMRLASEPCGPNGLLFEPVEQRDAA